MFKNLIIYRTGADWRPTPESLDEAIGKAPFVDCAPTQQKSIGFVPPRGEANAPLIERIDGQVILKLRTEVRSVPAATVLKRVDEIAAQIEKQTGRKPGKKQRKELKEQALHELLPMAFTKTGDTLVWINPESRTLVVNSASQSKADEIVTLLARTLEGLAISLIQTQMSPAAAMAHWLGTGEAPHCFTIDRECELKSCDEMKSVVRYGRHNLDTDEVKQHIVSGKVPTKLAMTWRDRVSFVLTDSMQVRKVAFLDVVFEGQFAGEFDADVAISTGELKQMLPDLIDALGGEAEAPKAPTVQPAQFDRQEDELIAQARALVIEHKRASISLVQRYLRIGYNRAATLLEALEAEGTVSHMKPDGSREILNGGAA